VADPRNPGERASRARDVLAAAAAIGMPAAAIVTPDAEEALEPLLTPAGRIVCPEDALVAGPAAALLGVAVPLQLLAERLARARGTNPDTIRREEPAYAEAAARADRG
jgi:fructoselysine-6-P-deglycase FrlB-like protein